MLDIHSFSARSRVRNQHETLQMYLNLKHLGHLGSILALSKFLTPSINNVDNVSSALFCRKVKAAHSSHHGLLRISKKQTSWSNHFFI